MRWKSAIVLQLQSPIPGLSIFPRVCDFIVLQLIKTNPRFSVLLSVRFWGVRFRTTWLVEHFQFLLPICTHMSIGRFSLLFLSILSWCFFFFFGSNLSLLGRSPMSDLTTLKLSHDVLHKCRSCIIVATFGRLGPIGYEREDLPIMPMIITMIDQFRVLRWIIIRIDGLLALMGVFGKKFTNEPSLLMLYT